MVQQSIHEYVTPDDITENLANLSNLCLEVTDACNLACRYCVYRDFYLDYDERTGAKMPFQIGKRIFDYLADIWRERPSSKIQPLITIGFYGGEPLLNMKFIQQMVEYVRSVDVGRDFKFNMTTNAVLLGKYMDFLAQNDIRLLISLDGDTEGNSHRILKNGSASFNVVFANCKLLMDKYPDYFSRMVSFNSVLHNKNSVESTRNFIFNEFGKYPFISEVNPRGLDPAKVDEFLSIYKNEKEDIMRTPDSLKLEREMSIMSPRARSLVQYLYKECKNVFDDYPSLFDMDQHSKYRPCGGTCLPFEKKLFVSVSGKIFQCERCGQNYPLGMVSEGGVDLNVSSVAEIYNSLLSKVDHICSKCADKHTCYTCIYNLPDLGTDKPRCNSFCSVSQKERWKKSNREYLSDNPELYVEMVKSLHIL